MMVEERVFISTKADIETVALHFRALAQFLGLSLSSGEVQVTSSAPFASGSSAGIAGNFSMSCT